MDSQGRSRRTIKAPIRFDDEDYQSPSQTISKAPPASDVVASPVKHQPATQATESAATTPVTTKTQMKVKLPGLKPKPASVEKPPQIQKPKPASIEKSTQVQKPKPASVEKPPQSKPTSVEKPPQSKPASVEKPPQTQKPKPASVEKPPQILKPKPASIEKQPKIQKPICRPRTPPIFTDVVPNTVLPFWDARTASEEHEDDNVKELVHCQCEISEECGLMVQCETCLTWQHGHCLQIEKPEDVMDNYTCFTCSNPRLARESLRYAHDQEWLVKGKLKSFSNVEKEQDESSREALLQTSKLIEDVLEIEKILHSLKIKRKIFLGTNEESQQELKLWRRSWLKKQEVDSLPPTPVNMDDFNMEECRSNLGAHIRHIEEQVESKLLELEIKATQLEQSLGMNVVFEEDEVSFLKKSIKLLGTDLRTAKELVDLTT